MLGEGCGVTVVVSLLIELAMVFDKDSNEDRQASEANMILVAIAKQFRETLEAPPLLSVGKAHGHRTARHAEHPSSMLSSQCLQKKTPPEKGALAKKAKGSGRGLRKCCKTTIFDKSPRTCESVGGGGGRFFAGTGWAALRSAQVRAYDDRALR